MSEGRWVTPNEMFAAAKEMELDGRAPVSRKDWYKILTFVGINTDIRVGSSALKLFAALYDCPLEEEYIESVWLVSNLLQEVRNVQQNQT
jgi:hypothetical protein